MSPPVPVRPKAMVMCPERDNVEPERRPRGSRGLTHRLWSLYAKRNALVRGVGIMRIRGHDLLRSNNCKEIAFHRAAPEMGRASDGAGE